MGGECDRFLEASGSGGPLRLQWDDGSVEPASRDFDRPAVLVGRNPRSDLVLDHPKIGLRHVYFQTIEGRVFAVDLESREGVLWDGVPRRMGWVDPGTPLRVGPATIRVVAGDQAGGERRGAGPCPTSGRFSSRRPLPGAVLEIRVPGGKSRRRPVDRVLTLVGSSELCNLRLDDPGVSRFLCGLVHTPVGVWVVDLLSSRGVTVNGVARPQVRLEDGDLLRVGTVTMRLFYEGSAPRTDPAGIEASEPANQPGVAGAAVDPMLSPPRTSVELLPETILRPLLERGELGPDVTSAPFGQALIMLVNLLGDVHRDHLGLVREELEQIRRLGQDLQAMTAQASLGGRAAAPADEGHHPLLARNGDPVLSPEYPVYERIGPEAVQTVVGERIAAWERERQSRWRRVLDLLVKS